MISFKTYGYTNYCCLSHYGQYHLILDLVLPIIILCSLTSLLMQALDIEVESYFDGHLFKNKIWIGTVEGERFYVLAPILLVIPLVQLSTSV